VSFKFRSSQTRVPHDGANFGIRTLVAACVAGLCLLGATVLFAQAVLFAQDRPLQDIFDNLVAAYPNALASHDDKVLRWKDGAVMPLSDGAENKSFDALLRQSSIADQLRLPYPRGPLQQSPAVDSDPGRFRNKAFFTKMYGDCRHGEVVPHLVSVPWLPKTWLSNTRGHAFRITSVNGVDKQLRAVSEEIDALPDTIKHSAYPIAGTYNCRAVADTGEPSPHSYGIAIDLNTAVSDYWFWRPHNDLIAYRNRMPEEIVAIFEKHGFIWGGKWYHFDTMHFEYRPELLTPQ
jgi:hypothetical protein